ncbi:hypothetical protein VC83_01796 [Pseudogymnoascus destructans]|uniref:Spindle pole body component n=2 Tax=Pseudogymnoascus destructans TaxID=655981 RepID=L8G8C9_PSED2|nr:uncharacterized protein VC83_01796 [Pseudogymnoascus destructans]ELR08903.1 hypothetical protein GMDG_03572 [Pseudogymnoascus destructans 20631-21]OAF61789.1 hypothetical protein VC83_01796 [Pseudogymnoascus destructans]
MSHIAKIGALTDELVTTLTGLTPKNDPARFSACRESAVRSFRYGNYPRVNQFDVEQNLVGLEEKFRVYNKDGLANAFRQRLDELGTQSTKWTPEILHLFLGLSDRPVHKSRLKDLEFLSPPEEHVEPTYKWKDLVKDDPLLRDKIWRNIDYTQDSSEDDDIYSDSDFEPPSPTDTAQSSVAGVGTGHPSDLAIAIDSTSLNRLHKEQFWRATRRKPLSVVDAYFEKPPTFPITDLQAIRETLFMLRGLPTTLYSDLDKASSTRNNGEAIIRPASGFILPGVSHHVFYNILDKFSSYGTSLKLLRTWTPVDKRLPLLQRLHEQFQTRLRELDEIFSSLEEPYLVRKSDVIVSLAATEHAVGSRMLPFETLAKLVQEHHNSPPFRWLEALYDETCKFQLAENSDMYEFVGSIFFECFAIYLRPIKTWMEDGELNEASGFFVKEDVKNNDRMRIWEKYIIQNDETGAPYQTPKFLRTSAHKILTSGKSIVVLKELQQYRYMRLSWESMEPVLSFQTVCGDHGNSLLPFTELFDSAFEAWIKTKHHSTSFILRTELVESHHLGSVIDGLETVYFMTNGAMSNAFTSSIFDDLSRGTAEWNNPFSLTSHLRSTMGHGVGRQRISIKIAPSTADVFTARRTVKSLATIEICYDIPWKVALVIRPVTLNAYKRIAIFLLQIRRASYILSGSLSRTTSAPPLYYGLRTKLLWFSNTLYSYLTDIVLRVSMDEMRKNMATADEVDDMIEIHENFLKKVTTQALLGQRLELIHKTILQILDLAIALEDAQAMLAPPAASPTKVMPEEAETDSDSDSSFDSEDEGDLSIFPDQKDTPYPEHLRFIKTELDRLSRFVLVGLRGVARVGQESNWDILVEKMECGLSDGEGRRA